MAVYGYIRVSTRDQNEDRQRLALAEFHVPCETIYMDKLSGKDFNRPQYQKLQRWLGRFKLGWMQKLLPESARPGVCKFGPGWLTQPSGPSLARGRHKRKAFSAANRIEIYECGCAF